MLDMGVHEGGIKGDFLLSGLRLWQDSDATQSKGKAEGKLGEKGCEWGLRESFGMHLV